MINEQDLVEHNKNKAIIVEQMAEYFIEGIEENYPDNKLEKFDRLRMVEEQEQKYLSTLKEEEHKLDLAFNEQALKYIAEINQTASKLSNVIEELAKLETKTPTLQESNKFNFSL